MEEKQPIGFLFESVPYYSEESIELMVEKLTMKEIVFFLTRSLNYAHSKNIFSLTESEIISKSLRILNKEIYSYDDKPRQKSDNVTNY
jgi:hypothetical protein